MSEDPAKHQFSPVAPDLPAGPRWRTKSRRVRLWQARTGAGIGEEPEGTPSLSPLLGAVITLGCGVHFSPPL